MTKRQVEATHGERERETRFRVYKEEPGFCPGPRGPNSGRVQAPAEHADCVMYAVPGTMPASIVASSVAIFSFRL